MIEAHPMARALAWLGAGLAVLSCMVMTSRQIPYWRDSLSLFTRAADVTVQNYLACYNLGCYARDQGDYDRAIIYFKKALSAEKDDVLWANHSHAYNNLGYAYLHQGDIANAVTNFEKALEIQPCYPEAYYNMGRAFLANNQPDVAVDCLQRALAMDPNAAEVHYKLGVALAQLGRSAEALAQYSQARQLALAQNNQSLAAVLESQQRQSEGSNGGTRR
jgi:tetratricopeptide (TPR) repeat protein